ncbi:MAG: redox-sensitive bicupin YhaK (pirin superfamily) [Cryomorphaceae bacterium]|jgi:redox-sensitive bicupin YhaK (pirin superfamily)
MNSERRNFLRDLTLGLGTVIVAPFVSSANTVRQSIAYRLNLDPVIDIKPLGFQWKTYDPFLFCAHHEDDYPKGNGKMGPVGSLDGRDLGDDFIIKDGYRMYHGKKVPGFPGHPHRGFETVTIVRKGMVDHADSLGASGRYGDGDTQWMTAGGGVQHSEMFPLLNESKDNRLELFQVWLNLPRKNKMVDPYFKMLWGEDTPRYKESDQEGDDSHIEVIAGKLGGHTAPSPPPDSWAADHANEVGIWNINLDPNASLTLPRASKGVNRTLYYYEGDSLKIAGNRIPNYHMARVHADRLIHLENGNDNGKILVLQGKPINEPVSQYGPFVMNTKDEIKQAFDDYHKTQFGGWPWPRRDMVHDSSLGRFAKHADGLKEVKG